MDFNATVDLIIKELHEAHDIINDLRNYPGVPVIQVEMAKLKCKSAAEIIALLKNVQNGTAIKPATATATATATAQKTENETKAKTEPKTEPGFKAEPLQPEIEILEDTPPEKPAIAKKEIVAESPVITVKDEELHVTKKKSDARTIIADTFSDRPGCLNEQLTSSREDENLSEIKKIKPITNLSDAIGVNDRFLFIREIFNGDPKLFEQTIKRLDNAADLSDAKKILNDYTSESTDNTVLKQLLELIKRKFPVNE